MPNYSKGEVILVRYPFSNLSGSKIRPAVAVNAPHLSQDVILVPLTSRCLAPCWRIRAVGLESCGVERRFRGQARALYGSSEFYH